MDRCERWCRDYDVLMQELDRRGIRLDEHWRDPPAEGNFAALEVPEGFSESPKVPRNCREMTGERDARDVRVEQ